jgi:hypothetical protein
MTTVLDPPHTAAPARPIASYRADLVTALLSAWFAVGLMLDAWAHNNRPGLETFFTPWHAVFYSGYLATAAWLLWVCRGALRAGPRAGLAQVPVGYAPALVALVVFALGAVGDLAWHTAFGIEQALPILFSPTHLVLAASMVVILTTPLRSAAANPDVPSCPGLLRLLPAVLSTAFAATLVMLMLQYANVLTSSPLDVVFNLNYVGGDDTARFVSSLAVTTVVLTLAVLNVARRWRPPVGTATLPYLLVGALSAAVTGLRHPALLGAFVVAGLVIDLVGRSLRPGPDRPVRWFGYAALVPLVTWVTWLVAAFALAGPVDLGPDRPHPEAALELITGAPVLQALIGLLLAAVLVPVKPAVARTRD